MNSFYKNLGLWVIIGGVMILLYYLSQQGAPTSKEMVFSDFLNKIEAGDVTDVVIKEKQITGTLKDGVQFNTYVVDYPNLVTDLRAKNVKITKKMVEEALQKKAIRYDKNGEEHYNVISAFIKSMRESDPDGALYWLARMIEGGENPRFIARRMIIFASEDIGNALPTALVVAIAVAEAVEHVGMPEAGINLAHGATYLASAPKSNASYKGLLAALADAKEHGALPVPLHLRNAVTNLMKELGYHKGYKYAHDFKNAKVDQQHLPDKLKDRKYYRPPSAGNAKTPLLKKKPLLKDK